MAMIGNLAGVFSPQSQPLEQVYQTAHLFAAAAYTPGKAITLIPERRGYLKSVLTAKYRLFPKFGAEEKVTEQRRRTGGLVKEP